MRIAIDGHTIGSQVAGNEVFITETVEALASVDKINKYTLFLSNASAIEKYRGRWPNFKVRYIPHGKRFLNRLFSYNTMLRLFPADVFFSQFYVPKYCPCRAVALIADLSSEHHPETFDADECRAMQTSTRRSAAAADHIIAPSQYTANDIIKTYRLEPEKVTRIYHAASSRFRRIDDEAELSRIKKKYGISDNYILGVGTIQPRKNLSRLIEAYSNLKGRGIELPKLVLAGKIGWLHGEIVEAISRLGLADRVQFTGYVPDDDLPGLYSGSLFFVYPSYFEGFGLPPLEAMQCGTPVITGNLTSLPEVVGDAGIMVDPFDVGAIANAMKSLLSDADLRKSLSEKGIERAKKFSWTDAARQTLKIFEKVCSK